ncbi:WD40/YVTN/BNR-like repeat-containing protein [Puia sp. P3]|uniref:WD40/YVTN/BNR-like repeat-containing protein n=1 Tax=Puia sp. P3 TaxID=3423952 RepID=UPI003D66CD71
MKNPLYYILFLVWIALFCCFFTPIGLLAQETQPAGTPHASIQLLTTSPQASAPGARPTSIRGLSAVSDKIVWVSGSNGTVGRSVDGGATWTWTTVPGFEKRDFRDVEAFDQKTAIIMAIAEPADILKTTDGGKTWKLVYENKTVGMFMDAMEFWNHDSGIIVGDPINGRFFVTRTFDGGDSWHDIPYAELPKADSTEGCFATSGTNIRALSPASACFVSGGPQRSRLFIRDKAIDLPLLNGATSTGANSIAVKNPHTFIVTGGDFAKDTVQDKNCFLTLDGGATWIRPTTPPHGYRGCVEYINDSTVLCCGTSGVDISTDNGMNWNLISSAGFHVCHRAKKGKTVFLAGSNGRIAKLIF